MIKYKTFVWDPASCEKVSCVTLDTSYFCQEKEWAMGKQSFISVQFISVQSLGRVRLCNPMSRSTPSLPVHHQLPEFTQTHVHRVSDAIQPSHPLSSPSPIAPNPSQHQSLFQWVNIRWPKYWNFSVSISPSKEHPGLIFRMDRLDLLAVHWTLKSLLQHHSSKASIRCSVFFRYNSHICTRLLEKP